MPTTTKAATTVTLEATNEGKTGRLPSAFEWTVHEALRRSKAENREQRGRQAITPVIVKGTNLANVTPEGSPPDWN